MPSPMGNNSSKWDHTLKYKKRPPRLREGRFFIYTGFAQFLTFIRSSPIHIIYTPFGNE